MHIVKKMNVVYRYKDKSYYTKEVHEKITENYEKITENSNDFKYKFTV